MRAHGAAEPGVEQKEGPEAPPRGVRVGDLGFEPIEALDAVEAPGVLLQQPQPGLHEEAPGTSEPGAHGQGQAPPRPIQERRGESAREHGAQGPAGVQRTAHAPELGLARQGHGRIDDRGIQEGEAHIEPGGGRGAVGPNQGSLLEGGAHRAVQCGVEGVGVEVAVPRLQHLLTHVRADQRGVGKQQLAVGGVEQVASPDAEGQHAEGIGGGLAPTTKQARQRRAREAGQAGPDPCRLESAGDRPELAATEQLGAAEEHEGVKVLSLFVHGPGLLSNNIRRIETPDDLAGLKIRTPGGYIADLIGDLGATTLFMSSGEVYEKLTRGVIDGVTFPYDGLAQFKLADYLKYTMSVPGGFYNTTWFLVMNEDKWAEISDADRAAIEAISGEVFAELAGKAWDGSDAQSRAVVEKAGVEIHEATPETLAAIKAAAAGYEVEWAEAVSEGGYDGAAALAELRAQTGVTY